MATFMFPKGVLGFFLVAKHRKPGDEHFFSLLCPGLSTLQIGPKGLKMANIPLIDHLGPFLVHLDPFGPFQAKINLLR